MLKLSLLEIFFRAIPEEFLFVFSTYVFSKILINKKRYISSSILFTVSMIIIRSLPIKLGINTILATIALITISVFVNKFEIIKSIQVTIITIILEFICEALNFGVINVMGLNMNDAFRNNVTKILYSSPSLILFALFVFTYYYILLREKKLRVI